MQTRLPRRLVLAAASVPLAVGYAPPASAAPAPARYVVTDLGALGTGDFSVATAINNAGVVVGYSNVTPVLVHAFRWADGTLTDLGALPGDGNTSRATAVNDAGQVAGVSSRASGGFGYTVRWTGGVIQDFGSPNTFQLSFGTGIDPAGRVVGAQRPPDSRDLHPVRWSAAGAATDLGLPAGAAQAQANGVNVRGQIVGAPAFVWRSGAFTLLPPLPGANGATATAINVGGVVVGSSPAVTTNTVHAVRWRGLAVTDLGTVDGIAFSTATAINAAGQIVGTADPQCVPCPAPRAWLWDTGTITPLDSLIPAGSGWALQQANGINDRGQIVGAGLHNGQPHAYLLTPRFSATVNFQPAGAAVPVGYRADTGAVFGPRGSGLSYGWNADNRANARDRNAAASPDQRYDTLNHMQKPGGATRWDLAVPNGRYTVHVVAGDPVALDSTFRISVEGRLAVSGTPTGAARWLEGTVSVIVTDGRLTVANAAGAVNNKLNYIDVIAG